MKTKKIAVVGATGMVGRTFLSVLSEKGIDVKNVTALASNQSKGKQISFGEDDLLNVEVYRPLLSVPSLQTVPLRSASPIFVLIG